MLIQSIEKSLFRDVQAVGVMRVVYESLIVVSLVQHQQQVAAAVERAKQVTMTELNAIIGVRVDLFYFLHALL